MIRITLKTVKGEQIDVSVPPNSTIDTVIKELKAQHGFSHATSLMYGSKMAEGHRLVEEFPSGSLLIVGGGTATRTTSPQASKIRSTHHHGHPQTTKASQVDTEHSQRQQQQQAKQPQSPSPQHQRPVSPAASAAGTPLIVRGVVPALSKSIDIQLHSDATLADLMTAAIAIDSRLIGCKVVFRGKILSGPSNLLHSLGIRNGDAVHLATGQYTDINILNLFRIREDYERIRDLVRSDDTTEHQKKLHYEELMRVLFRTDELQDLEGDWRVVRKELVKNITALQDEIKGGQH